MRDPSSCLCSALGSPGSRIPAGRWIDGMGLDMSGPVLVSQNIIEVAFSDHDEDDQKKA